MQIRVDYDLDNEKLANIIASAQINYWADVHHWDRKSLTLGFTDDEVGLTYDLTALDFQAGLNTLALNYPHHFEDILAGDTDSVTGDVLIQCAAFGEVMYV